MLLRSAALTDTGKVRARNEDRFLCDDDRRLYAVADGIGGLPGGAEAAQKAIDGLAAAAAHAPADWDLVALMRDLNVQVVACGRELGSTIGIGTTLVLARLRAGTLHLAHVGDSRGYVWSEGRIELLTSDHNWENEARQRRARGERALITEANRNALTRCLGQDTPPETDLLVRPLRAGERHLLCSDGITRLVRDVEIAETLGGAPGPAEALVELVRLANLRGGYDNATGVAFFIDALD